MAQYTDIHVTSRLTGISEITLRRGAKNGRFPHIRTGNTSHSKILFDLQTVALVLATEAQSSIHQTTVGTH